MEAFVEFFEDPGTYFSDAIEDPGTYFSDAKKNFVKAFPYYIYNIYDSLIQWLTNCFYANKNFNNTIFYSIIYFFAAFWTALAFAIFFVTRSSEAKKHF